MGVTDRRSQPYGSARTVPLTTRVRGARYGTIGRANTHRTGARPETPLPRKERRAGTWFRSGGAGDIVSFRARGRARDFTSGGRFSRRLIAEILPRSAVGKRAGRGARGQSTHLGGGDARDGVDGSDSSHCYRSVCAVMARNGRVASPVGSVNRALFFGFGFWCEKQSDWSGSDSAVHWLRSDCLPVRGRLGYRWPKCKKVNKSIRWSSTGPTEQESKCSLSFGVSVTKP